MNRRQALNIGLLTALCLVGSSAAALSQQKKFNPKQLTGHWTLVSIDDVAADGTRTAAFGPTPSGVAIFEPNHRFSVSLLNPNVPKFASSNRGTGTADENKAAVLGSLFYFGTYSLANDGTLSLEVEGSSFPNWVHVSQQRKLSQLTANDLKWTNPAASVGGTAETTWKRTK